MDPETGNFDFLTGIAVDMGDGDGVNMDVGAYQAVRERILHFPAARQA